MTARKPPARWRRGNVHDRLNAIAVLTRDGRAVAWVFRRRDWFHWHVSLGHGEWLRGREQTLDDAKVVARNALRRAEVTP